MCRVGFVDVQHATIVNSGLPGDRQNDYHVVVRNALQAHVSPCRACRHASSRPCPLVYPEPGSSMESDQSLLSVGDVARRLDRSTEQVRRYLREGRLTGRRIGGQWFIDRDTLDQFSQSLRVPQTFVEKLGRASSVRPLDDVIGIGKGGGSNIGEGKAAYRSTIAERS